MSRFVPATPFHCSSISPAMFSNVNQSHAASPNHPPKHRRCGVLFLLCVPRTTCLISWCQQSQGNYHAASGRVRKCAGQWICRSASQAGKQAPYESNDMHKLIKFHSASSIKICPTPPTDMRGNSHKAARESYHEPPSGCQMTLLSLIHLPSVVLSVRLQWSQATWWRWSIVSRPVLTK